MPAGNGQAWQRQSRVLGPHLSAPETTWTTLDPQAQVALLDHAERICAHRFDLFHLTDCLVGSKINWNYDYSSGTPTALDFAGDIDYRDYRVVGDAKFVWELNRHLHLPVLGRAYRLSGDRRYAQEVVDQIASWIEACPFAAA